jgi:sugar phosphate isomerase/epimerase
MLSPRLALLLLPCLPVTARAAESAPPFDRANTVAWCIVPFDGQKRTPAARAAMVSSLGLTKVAYDWRAEHVAEFEQEFLEYRRQGIELFAFWSAHEEAFRLFAKHGLRPQIWQTAPSPGGTTQEERVAAAVDRLLPLVKRTRELGCRLGLYNHGGWGGEPENLVAVCERLRRVHDADHVGIVYNFHHGHAHVDRLASALTAMRPYLLCLNLNGMMREGDRRGMKIFPLGQGELDLPLLRVVADSGYRGPIGVIGHTQDDVELRLRDNLEGLDWLAAQVAGLPAGPRPVARVPLLPRTPAPAGKK